MVAHMYYRYGTMASSKTLNLLSTRHSYLSRNKKVLLFTPAVDTRYGVKIVESRAGLRAVADLVIKTKEDLYTDVKCILVDECQFLDVQTIDALRSMTFTNNDIMVICYGLKTDFNGHLFEGSKRLLEIADQIEEIKTNCYYCVENATMNKRISKEPISSNIDIGDSQYLPTCYDCFVTSKEDISLV